MLADMTDQQRLDAANAKYDAAVASPSVSMYPGAGNVAVAYTELAALLFDLRKNLVVKEKGNG